MWSAEYGDNRGGETARNCMSLSEGKKSFLWMSITTSGNMLP